MVGRPRRPPRRRVPFRAKPHRAGAGREGNDGLDDAAAVGEDGGAVLAAIAGQREVDAGDAVVIEDLEVGHGGVIGDARRVGRPGHGYEGRRRHAFGILFLDF